MRALMVFVLLAATALAAAAQEAKPDWAPPLEQQLLDKESCKLMYMLNVREFELLGEDVVEARVHCDDGRSFDASRKGSAPFTFRACEPTVC